MDMHFDLLLDLDNFVEKNYTEIQVNLLKTILFNYLFIIIN